MSEATTTRTATAPAPSKTVNIVIWVLQVLGAVMFIYAGLAKIGADPQQIQGFEAMGLGVTGMYVVGVLEVAGGIGLLLPGVAGFAAAALVALMIGATVLSIGLMGLVPLIAVPVLTLVVVAIIAWVRRREALAFVRFVLGR
jgi:uncharacterized membrane protein